MDPVAEFEPRIFHLLRGEGVAPPAARNLAAILADQVMLEAIRIASVTSMEALEGLVLTERQRQCWELRCQDRTYKEIAAAVKISPGAVAFHLHKAREVLSAKESQTSTPFHPAETNPTLAP